MDHESENFQIRTNTFGFNKTMLFPGD